jgi:hypothetical protein
VNLEVGKALADIQRRVDRAVATRSAAAAVATNGRDGRRGLLGRVRSRGRRWTSSMLLRGSHVEGVGGGLVVGG